MTILTFLLCWIAVSIVVGLFLGAFINTKPDSLVPAEPHRPVTAYALRRAGGVEAIYFTVRAETGAEAAGKVSTTLFRSDAAWPNGYSALLPVPAAAAVDCDSATAAPRIRRLRTVSRTLGESGRMMKTGGQR